MRCQQSERGLAALSRVVDPHRRVRMTGDDQAQQRLLSRLDSRT